MGRKGKKGKGGQRGAGPGGRAGAGGGGPGRRQYAALPLAAGQDGRPLVMLVTSRETRRWVIPKGNPEEGLAPHALAAKEAYEEAGLVGVVGSEPVGAFRYAKRLGGGKTVLWVASINVVEIRLSPEAATGQAARGGNRRGSGESSSAMASSCM